MLIKKKRIRNRLIIKDSFKKQFKKYIEKNNDNSFCSDISELELELKLEMGEDNQNDKDIQIILKKIILKIDNVLNNIISIEEKYKINSKIYFFFKNYDIFIDDILLEKIWNLLLNFVYTQNYNNYIDKNNLLVINFLYQLLLKNCNIDMIYNSKINELIYNKFINNNFNEKEYAYIIMSSYRFLDYEKFNKINFFEKFYPDIIKYFYANVNYFNNSNINELECMLINIIIILINCNNINFNVILYEDSINIINNNIINSNGEAHNYYYPILFYCLNFNFDNINNLCKIDNNILENIIKLNLDKLFEFLENLESFCYQYIKDYEIVNIIFNIIENDGIPDLLEKDKSYLFQIINIFIRNDFSIDNFFIENIIEIIIENLDSKYDILVESTLFILIKSLDILEIKEWEELFLFTNILYKLDNLLNLKYNNSSIIQLILWFFNKLINLGNEYSELSNDFINKIIDENTIMDTKINNLKDIFKNNNLEITLNDHTINYKNIKLINNCNNINFIEKFIIFYNSFKNMTNIMNCPENSQKYSSIALFIDKIENDRLNIDN